MKNLKVYFFILTSICLSSCGTLMKDVMISCDRGQEFDSYSYCIKDKYSKEGRQPNDQIVRAFYAHLDAITEAYQTKKITNAQAKSYAYDAFMKTIQADNNANAASPNPMAAFGSMQQPRRMPIQTNCFKNGAYTNCTSY